MMLYECCRRSGCDCFTLPFTRWLHLFLGLENVPSPSQKQWQCCWCRFFLRRPNGWAIEHAGPSCSWRSNRHYRRWLKIARFVTLDRYVTSFTYYIWSLFYKRKTINEWITFRNNKKASAHVYIDLHVEYICVIYSSSIASLFSFRLRPSWPRWGRVGLPFRSLFRFVLSMFGVGVVLVVHLFLLVEFFNHPLKASVTVDEQLWTLPSVGPWMMTRVRATFRVVQYIVSLPTSIWDHFPTA